jgi:hypothetical protein
MIVEKQMECRWAGETEVLRELIAMKYVKGLCKRPVKNCMCQLQPVNTGG